MRNISVFLFVTIPVFLLYAQQPTNWKNYTNMKQTNSVQAVEGGVWAASLGGGFFYDAASSEYSKFTKTEGMFTTLLTAVCEDDYGKIWFGSSNGAINVFDPSNNSVKTLLDIYNSDRVNKQINNLSVSGDTIFASTEFGLTLLDAKSLVFYDTYSKFGILSSFIRVVSSFKQNLIYASTEFGIAVQKNGATNLSAPESWNIFNTGNGLPSNVIRKVKSYRDTIIAATDKGLSRFNGTSWQTFLPGLNNVNINDIIVSNDTLIIAADFSIYHYYQGNLSTIFSSPTEIKKISQSNAGLFAATSQGVFKIEDATIYKLIMPNGPKANQFPDMTVDNEGNLWCASGTDVSGAGIYKYDGAKWEDYDVTSYPPLFNNGYFSIFCSSDNTIFAGNWGQGFAKITTNKIQRFHAGNSILAGIPTDPNFVVVTGFAEDSKNNIWITNLRASDRKSLYMLTPDSVWYSFLNPLEQQASFSEVKNLVIDQYNTKWYSILGQGSLGLFYFNENASYSNSADDYFGYITKTNGLNDNVINCIVPDVRGDLWVGTALGVNIITNSNSVLSANPQLKMSSVFSLRQQTINCIAVDPLNQKWVGTNQGLLLVNSDGSRLIATYNSRNSALLADEIRSIAIDENKGRVYVGTDAGLTSFETPSVKPLESFAELVVYPNPLFVESKHDYLVIDGLIKDSEIKILNVSGKLISHFSSPGGRVAYWDGKDLEGKFVSSGVYIIVAYDQDGNNVATSKVAVLRNK